MLLRVSKLLVVLALIFSLGLHWMLLQSVAWVGMVVSYSQNAPLKQALEKTFSGQHPCALCKVVQEGTKSEKKQEAQGPTAKLDLLFIRAFISIDPAQLEPLPFHASATLLVRAHEPPSPPPKNLLG